MAQALVHDLQSSTFMSGWLQDTITKQGSNVNIMNEFNLKKYDEENH